MHSTAPRHALERKRLLAAPWLAQISPTSGPFPWRGGELVNGGRQHNFLGTILLPDESPPRPAAAASLCLLERHQASVVALLGHQLRVGAALHHTPPLQDVDGVRALDRAQPALGGATWGVRDCSHRVAGAQLVERSGAPGAPHTHTHTHTHTSAPQHRAARPTNCLTLTLNPDHKP